MLRAAMRLLELLLEWVLSLLMVALTGVVVAAVLFRISGHSLSWYDEVAAILLAWITYYGSGLAALRRRHIGFDTVLLAIPMPWRMAGVALAEGVTAAFFLLMAWAGWEVLMVLEGMYLTSLTWVPVQLTQSVIPIGAVLFLIGQALSLPDYWAKTARGVSLEHAEIEEEVAAELKKAGAA